MLEGVVPPSRPAHFSLPRLAGAPIARPLFPFSGDGVAYLLQSPATFRVAATAACGGGRQPLVSGLASAPL